MKGNFAIQNKEEDLRRAVDYLVYLFANGKRYILEEDYNKRTIKQNSYMWLLLTYIGVEIGYTKDEMHDEYQKMFLSYKKNRKRFVRKTSSLNTKEMTVFISQFRYHALNELGVPTPEPNEEDKIEILAEDLKKYAEFTGSNDFN